MNKKLCKQLWNERRSNVAIWFELLLISVALWYVTDTLYGKLRVYFQPRGMDISHTYRVTLDRLTEDNPAYDPARAHTSAQDINAMRELIAQRADVEAAAIAYQATPYSGGWDSDVMIHDSVEAFVKEQYITPEMIRVFRYTGLHGETSEELEELFRNGGGGWLFNGEIFRELGIRNEDIPGLYLRHSPTRMFKKLTQLKTVRRNDYLDEWNAGAVFVPIYGDFFTESMQICIRVKEDQENGFIERFRKDALRHYRMGNLFVDSIEPMQEVRRKFHKYDEAQNKILYGIMIFLLFNVFIALFGVFWFRTRQRRREIALHMAMGSSRKQILRRLISEGLLLLVLATLPALLIDYGIMRAELVDAFRNEYFTPVRFGLTTGITCMFIALTIVCSVWYPAYKATFISPAEALNEAG